MFYLDLVSSILALIATALFVNANMLMWPFTFIAAIFEAILFFKVGIYGDMLLAFGYAFSAIYGWYNWKYGGTDKTELEISTLSWKYSLSLLVIAISSINILAYYLQSSTKSNVAYLDASTTVLSIMAQWLICQKKIETWILWFVADLLYVYLYIYKGINFHAIVAGIFVLLAIAGFYRWRQMYNLDQGSTAIV